MAKAKRGKCRSCGARIMWVKTTKGKMMPIDVDPCICEFQVPGEFYRDPVARPVIVFREQLGVIVGNNELFSAHHCHFDTCPNADEHRKS